MSATRKLPTNYNPSGLTKISILLAAFGIGYQLRKASQSSKGYNAEKDSQKKGVLPAIKMMPNLGKLKRVAL